MRIADIRVTPIAFRDPPGVQLGSAEALSRIEVVMGPDGGVGQVFLGQADVRDCFYRMLIRQDLAEYFALPPVRVRDVVDLVPELAAYDPDFLIHPCFGALPMGFSWSLYVAQRNNETVVAKEPLLA